MNPFVQKLQTLDDKNRRRTLAHTASGVDLTSNDYLGLADHPVLRQAAITALENGLALGAKGSRLLGGNTPEHGALEEFCAHHFHAPRTLFFATGFQANSALFSALPARQDTIIFDNALHASAREGIQNANARHIRIPHNDLNLFEDALKKTRAHSQSQIFIAVESVYSMDGDKAPLAELYTLAEEYDAFLVIDEAHGTGVFGEQGKGLAHALIMRKGYERIITLHTCGKAVGVAGGILCARTDIIDVLVNTARGFIYSTAPMPLQALLVRESLKLMAGPEGQTRREKLWHVCGVAQNLFGGAGTPIVPILIGEDKRALYIAKQMRQAGYALYAVRPPTVPEGTARLRVSLNTELHENTLHALAQALDPFLKGSHAA